LGVSGLRGRKRGALAAEILGMYLRVRWLLLRRGLHPTVAALRKTGEITQARRDEASAAGADRLAHATIRMLRMFPADDRCLFRSLVLTGLLARRGIASTLVIGVDPGPRFAAHAWVEHDGVQLLEAGEFHRLAEL
jgi:Transglutaminase-like superfamily